MLVVAVGLVLSFRVAGAADAPVPRPPRTEAEWDRLYRSARVSAYAAASVEYWQRQGALAQTEAWAKKSVERMESFQAESDAGLDATVNQWVHGGRLITALTGPARDSMGARDWEILFAVARTEAAVKKLIEMADGYDLIYHRVREESEKKVSSLRAEFLGGG